MNIKYVHVDCLWDRHSESDTNPDAEHHIITCPFKSCHKMLVCRTVTVNSINDVLDVPHEVAS